MKSMHTIFAFSTPPIGKNIDFLSLIYKSHSYKNQSNTNKKGNGKVYRVKMKCKKTKLNENKEHRTLTTWGLKLDSCNKTEVNTGEQKIEELKQKRVSGIFFGLSVQKTG